MEKELDLLIATEMSGDGDSVAEELRSVFAKRGVTVHRIEFRSGKDSVIRSVRANPQIHAGGTQPVPGSGKTFPALTLIRSALRRKVITGVRG